MGIDGARVEASVGELLELVDRVRTGIKFVHEGAGVGIDREARTRTRIVAPLAAGGVDLTPMRLKILHVT